MLQHDDFLAILRQSGALLDGHFILTSGRHSPHYIEKFRVLEQPRYTEMLCRELAERAADLGVSVVVGPMTGGIILAYEVGKQLGTRAIFTERVDGVMKFRRGFSLAPDDRVFIVEDIVTTGGSVNEVIEVVRESGATIVGIGLLVDRSGGAVRFPYETIPLLTLDVVTYPPDACPLCESGSVAVKPGSSGKK